jgi:hypothetical protein
VKKILINKNILDIFSSLPVRLSVESHERETFFSVIRFGMNKVTMTFED